MPVTSTDIVNEAIQRIGDNQPLVTGVAPTFDGSPAGIAAASLYTPVVRAVARRFEWDMARNTVALTLSGNPAPFGWTFEYLYPANGVEVWQLTPAALTDPNNPLPTNWVVGNAVVGGVQKKVIHTTVTGALAIYNNSPTEDVWDSLFREAVVSALASAFGMALMGRPDTSKELFDASNILEAIGEGRDG